MKILRFLARQIFRFCEMPGCDTPSVAGQLETTTQPKVIYHFVKKDAKDAKIAFSPTVNFSFFYTLN